MRSSDTGIEPASGSGSPAPVKTIVVTDGPPSLNERAALTLALIVRDWLETAGKADGDGQDSAA